MITGGKYTQREIYNTIFEYKCEEGYHFESFGCNYGRTIYGSEKLENHYEIKPDKKDENNIDKKVE